MHMNGNRSNQILLGLVQTGLTKSIFLSSKKEHVWIKRNKSLQEKESNSKKKGNLDFF